MAVAPLMLAFASSVAAQTASPQIVPPTLDPNRLQDNLEKPVEPVPTAPRVTRSVPQQAAPEAAATTRFVLRSVRIEGATVIPEARLLREWDKHPGEEISVEDVFRFANAITRAYAQAGYAIAFGVVPEQKIADGDITIRVVEGFVSRIDFTGAKLPSGLLGRGPVADIAERIRQSRPLRNADLERALLLINDVPGVTARATLSPAPDVVGGSKGDGKSWFDPANWAGGAIPDGANVADVTLSPSVAVTFDGTGTVSIDRLITSPDTDTVSNGTDTALTLLRGNLAVAKDLTVDTLVQRGGSLTGTGNVKVLDGLVQSSGTIAMTGDVSINQGAGDLETLSISGRDISLTGVQAVRTADTTASRDLVIVAGDDIQLAGPTIIGRNMSLTAGKNGAATATGGGRISQAREITVVGDAVLNAVGDIALTTSGNRSGGKVSCTSSSGSVSGSCTTGGAVDQVRRSADEIAGRLAAITSASGGSVGTLSSASGASATTLFAGGPAAANAGVITGSSESAVMPLDTLAVVGTSGPDTTYTTARFDEKDTDGVYRRFLPKTNVGGSVYYVGN